MRTRILLATLLCAAFSCAALAQTPGTPGTFKEDILRPSSNGASADQVGVVTVNIKNGTAGDSQITLSSAGITPGLPPHTTYSVAFCILASNPLQCHAVTTITTDASGNAQKNFIFP